MLDLLISITLKYTLLTQLHWCWTEIFKVPSEIITATFNSFAAAGNYSRPCTNTIGDYSRPVPLAVVGDSYRCILRTYLKVEFYCNKGLASTGRNLAAKELNIKICYFKLIRLISKSLNIMKR